MLNGVKVLGACALLAATAACSSGGYATFEHPDVSDEQAMIDAQACGAEKNSDAEGVVVTVLASGSFDDCMKAKGYIFKSL